MIKIINLPPTCTGRCASEHNVGQADDERGRLLTKLLQGLNCSIFNHASQPPLPIKALQLQCFVMYIHREEHCRGRQGAKNGHSVIGQMY